MKKFSALFLIPDFFVQIKRQKNLKSFSLFNILFIFATSSVYNSTRAQEAETKINIPIRSSSENYKKTSLQNFETAETLSFKEVEVEETVNAQFAESELTKTSLAPVDFENQWRLRVRNTDKTNLKNLSVGEISSQIKAREKFHWKPALIQSGIFLGIQHGFRMKQEKTRSELGGKFFPDWANSVKNLRGWEDGDGFFTNYVAHPLQGGLMGRIFINNSDRAKKQEFGKSKEYWTSRFKALAWSAAWSAQFELGPISEATIGNVGLRQKNGHSTMAYVDLVITPTLGTVVLIGEDAIDKYILKNWVERNATKSTFKIRMLRSFLTPTTSIANLLRGQVPWKRDRRLH